MNKVILLGNLTRDPEQRQTKSGVEVSIFTLAVNRQFKNKNGDYEADFIRCIAFGRTAELIGQYLSKGSKCAIEGRIQTRNYEVDGQTRYVTEIVAENVQFIGKGKTPNQSQNADTSQNEASQIDPYGIDDSDLPF